MRFGNTANISTRNYGVKPFFPLTFRPKVLQTKNSSWHNSGSVISSFSSTRCINLRCPSWAQDTRMRNVLHILADHQLTIQIFHFYTSSKHQSPAIADRLPNISQPSQRNKHTLTHTRGAKAPSMFCGGSLYAFISSREPYIFTALELDNHKQTCSKIVFAVVTPRFYVSWGSLSHSLFQLQDILPPVFLFIWGDHKACFSHRRSHCPIACFCVCNASVQFNSWGRGTNPISPRSLL